MSFFLKNSFETFLAASGDRSSGSFSAQGVSKVFKAEMQPVIIIRLVQ